MLATFETGTPGLATVGFTILNADKSVFQARSTTGVTEIVAGSGVYGVELDDATISGKTLVWDTGEAPARYGSDANPSDNVLARKILTNKLVDHGATIDVYDDDGETLLGTWTWSQSTKTRGGLS
jgi:hypothetical protein